MMRGRLPGPNDWIRQTVSIIAWLAFFTFLLCFCGSAISLLK